MDNVKQFEIKNSKGETLNVCEGIETENTKGVILFLHGIGAHHQLIYECEDCFLYKSNLFGLSNYKSYGLEFSGHGKSEGLRCSIDQFEDLIDEIRIMILFIKEKYENKKIFIYAESMGAGLSIVYDLKYKKESYVDGYILMSPLCGITDKIKPNYFMKEILFNLSYVIPTTPFLGAMDHIRDACKNKKFLEKKLVCPYQYNGKVRLNTARECYRICEYIESNEHKFDSPVYLFHGIDDTITDAKKSIRFYRNISSENKKLYLTKDSNHIVTLGINDDDNRPSEILNKVINFFNELTN